MTRTPQRLLSPGLRHMAVAALLFSLMSVLVKLAGERLPSQQIVLARAVFTLVLSWGLLRRAGIPVLGNRKGLLLLRGGLGFAGMSAFYWAIAHLPLAEVTVVHYTNPIFTAVLAALVLRERIGPREGLALVGGLAGVVIVARPALLFGGASSLSPLAVGVALAGAVIAAAAYVTVRELGRTEDPLVVVFYFPLVAAPAALPTVIPVWVWPTPWEWLLLLGVGLTTQIAQVELTRGLKVERAGRAMTVGYLQIVFAVIWGVLFFGENPSLWVLAGSALVIGSTLLVGSAGPQRAAAPVPGPEPGR